MFQCDSAEAEEDAKVRDVLGSFKAAEGLLKQNVYGVERMPPTPLPADKKRKGFPAAPHPGVVKVQEAERPVSAGSGHSEARRQPEAGARPAPDARVRLEDKLSDPNRKSTHGSSSSSASGGSANKPVQKPVPPQTGTSSSHKPSASSSSQKVPKPDRPDSVKQPPVSHSIKHPPASNREPVLESFNHKFGVQNKPESSKSALAPAASSNQPALAESRPVLKEKEGNRNVNGRIKKPHLIIPEVMCVCQSSNKFYIL